MAIKLGKIKSLPKYVKVSDDADNQSILILGRSGSGKTYALQKIEKNIVQAQGTVLVLNFHATHSNLKDQEAVHWINAIEDGIPLSLLTPVKRPDESVEDAEIISEWILDIFCNVSPLGVRQKRMLRKAVRNVMSSQEARTNEAKAMGDALMELHDDIAETVYDKYHDFFTKGKIGGQQTLVEKGTITVIDFEGYSVRTQDLLAEMVLSLIWRYFQIWGRYVGTTLFIVCDEFQNLNLQRESVLHQILREGRKHNLALLLATQTLQGLKTEKKAVLQQAATRLYFRPASNEIRGILKELGIQGVEELELRKLMLTLNRGEAIVSGKLEVGSLIIEKPIKISFQE